MRQVSRRAWIAGALAIVTVAGLAVAVVLGHRGGYPGYGLTVASGTAWLPSERIGELTLVDGSAGAVAASVEVAPAGTALLALQQGPAGYALDRSGRAVVHIEPSTLETNRSAVLSGGGRLAGAASGDLLYLWDEQTGRLSTMDHATLAPGPTVIRLPAPVRPGTVTTDPLGWLWALDPATGELTVVRDGLRLPTVTVAGPGPARITTTAGQPAIVDPTTDRISLLDARTGVVVNAAPVDLPGDGVFEVAGSDDHARVLVVTGGRLVSCELVEATCRDVVLPGGGRLGAPVEAGGHAFVPDPDHGRLWLIDLTTMAVTAQVPLFSRPRPYDLVVRDGIVFYNDPAGPEAGVVGVDGTVRRIAKYGVGSGPGPTVAATTASRRTATGTPTRATATTRRSATPSRTRLPTPSRIGPSLTGPIKPPPTTGPGTTAPTTPAPTTPAPTTPPPTGCQAEWSNPEVPGPGTGTVIDVAAVAGDGWAVGYAGAQTAPTGRILRWDGAGWHVAAAGPVSGSRSHLQAVARGGPGTAWAVGFQGDGVNPDQMLIQHWDGTAWATVPTPASNTGFSVLTDVWAPNATEAWVTGYYQDGPYVWPLLMYYNGAAWYQVGVPVSTAITQLDAVSGTDSTDVWIAGFTVAADGVFHPHVLHFNGTAVTPVPVPATSGAGALWDVSVPPGSAPWFVGQQNASTTASRVLALRWNGSALVEVSPPDRAGAYSELQGVSALAGDDVWAVGVAGRDGSSGFGGTALVEHWDGGSWTRLAAPAARPADVEYFSLVPAGPGQLVGAGGRRVGQGIAPVTLAGSCLDGP